LEVFKFPTAFLPYNNRLPAPHLLAQSVRNTQNQNYLFILRLRYFDISQLF